MLYLHFFRIAASSNVHRVVATMSASSGSGGTPSNEFATGRAVVKNLQELCEGEVRSQSYYNFLYNLYKCIQ